MTEVGSTLATVAWASPLPVPLSSSVTSTVTV